MSHIDSHEPEQACSEDRKSSHLTGPLVTGPGKLGPRFPTDENFHDFVWS
jgi:hypothetical protein